MRQGEALEGRVDRRAAGPRVHRLVRPVQGAQLQDVARPDGIGVAGQALDPGHEQRRRPVRGGRDRRAGVWRGGVVGGRVQAARPVQRLRPAGECCTPAPLARVSSRQSQRDFTDGAPLAALGSAAGSPRARRRPGRSRGRPGPRAAPAAAGPASRASGRDRKGSSGAPRGQTPSSRPATDQPVGAHQPGLDGAQDAQARMGRAAGPHRLALHQPLQQVGEAARRGLRQAARPPRSARPAAGSWPRRHGRSRGRRCRRRRRRPGPPSPPPARGRTRRASAGVARQGRPRIASSRPASARASRRLRPARAFSAAQVQGRAPRRPWRSSASLRALRSGPGARRGA